MKTKKYIFTDSGYITTFAPLFARLKVACGYHIIRLFCLELFILKNKVKQTDQFVMSFTIKPYILDDHRLKGLAQAKIIKKSVILFRVLNMTI